MSDTPEPATAIAMTDEQVQTEATALARPGADPTGFLSIIREAAANKTDPATMRELLNVYKDAQAQRAAEAYAEAIVKFRRKVRPIIMTGHRDDRLTGGKVHYHYAELTTTIEQIQPILDECQLTPTWRMTKSEPTYVELECVVTHVLKHQESSGPFGSSVGDGVRGQSPVQIRQGVATSLKRATLFMVLGLTTKEDDQSLGEAEQGQKPPEPPKPPTADAENQAKREFWQEAQDKAGVSFTANQARDLFQRIQEASGCTSAVECLAFLRRDEVLVGSDGSLGFVTDPQPEPFGPDSVAEADQTPAAPSETIPAPSGGSAPKPPSLPPFVCTVCGLGHTVKPAGGKCLGRYGATCKGSVVQNSATWECKAGHRFAYADIKPCGAAPKGICPICDKQGKIMAGINPAGV